MKLIVFTAVVLVLLQLGWATPPRREQLEQKYADAMKALTRATETVEEIINPVDREEIEDLGEDKPEEDASVAKPDADDDDDDDIPGIRIFRLPYPFSTMVNQRRVQKHWWEKENVCVNRKVTETPKNKTEDADSITSFILVGETHFSSCSDRVNKFVCLYVNSNTKGTNRTEVTYTCCSGYRRSKESGLCEQVETKPVLESATDHGAGKFASLVKSSGLGKLLEKENITIFAPTDEAMAEYHPSSAAFNRLETNELIPGELLEESEASLLVQSHILPDIIETDDMDPEEVVNTEANGTLRFNLYEGADGPIRTVNCAKLRSINHLIPNGVLHTVDKVLTTPTKSLQELLLDEKYSRFYKALSSLDFKWGDGWTVLALGNDAMDKLDSYHGCTKKIVASHILRRSVCKAALSGGPVKAAALQSWVALNVTEDGRLSAGDGEAVLEDVVATDGVLHELDQPYIPLNARSFEKLLKQNNYEYFVELLERAGLLSEVEDAEDLLILLPSLEVLEQNKGMLEKMDREELRNLLLNHMVIGDINPASKSLTTKLSNKIPLSIKQDIFAIFGGEQSSIGCFPAGASAEACNGRVQVVKGLLRPPNGTLYELIQSMEDLMGFRDILEGTKLEKELKDGLAEPVTLLAPSSQAWMKLGGSNLEALLKDKELADQILRNHLIKDITCCSSVSVSLFPFMNGGRVQTISGKTMPVFRDRKVHFGSSTVTQCDMAAKDGMIHTVDKVILYKNQQFKDSEVIFTNGPKEIILGF